MNQLPEFVINRELDKLELPRFLSVVRRRRSELLASSRALTEREIETLEVQGNCSGDWKLIRVAEKFSCRNIHRSTFIGSCYLGFFDGSELPVEGSFALPNGICDSVLKNVVVDDGVAVWKCAGIDNYFIGKAALLLHNGIMTASTAAIFGNGTECVLGNETGGREVALFAELTVSLATIAAKERNLAPQYNAFVNAYRAACTAGFGVIGDSAIVCGCGRMADALLLPFARVSNATLLENVTILSSKDERAEIKNGAVVKDSCVQWGCEVDTMAIVEKSLLAEHSHVERHGKVTNSIIGPNTGIAEGEVTSCLVGPFVGFHHQALLIGALWPEGKGNVAYGANVGSNHTAKAPDQEIYCGEGLFFGLGVNIKFPADFSCAPYSIIATGVCTLPQKMTFPFSLINTPSQIPDGVSPAVSELVPAWVLSDNLYLVKRSEGKFASRNKAKRELLTFTVFRAEIIDMMMNAVAALRKVPADKACVFEKELPGCGKNFVTAANVKKAIATYRMFIEYYVLGAFMKELSEVIDRNEPVDVKLLFAKVGKDAAWEHARTVALREGLAQESAADNLRRLRELSRMMHTSIVSAKEKDDVRGRNIMNDYDAVHKNAVNDPFIVKHAAETKVREQEIDALLARLDRV